MSTRYRVTELLGDGIGPELAASVYTVVEQLPIHIEFEPVDLSLPARHSRGAAVYEEAAESVRRNRWALKYPTITAEESPNQVLRKLLGFTVIHRPVATIPGVPTNFRKDLDVDIIRIATGGTYDDPGRTIGTEAAVSLRIVERQPCWEAARYAFSLGRKTQKTVTSASKYTIQRATDGLFKSVVAEVAREFPDVEAHEDLFDALLAKVIMHPERYQIVLVLNEYGDFLSDMACGLAGSMGIGASASLSFDGSDEVKLGLFDPAGGTAPDIAGANKANPTAIFLALAQMLYQMGEVEAASTVKNSTLDLLRDGITTPDLGGDRTTTQFTEAVAGEVSRRLAPVAS